MARDRVFRWREGAEQLGITETREQAKERGRRRREKDTPELHITANRCSPITEAAGRRGATQPRLTWLIWPPFKLPHIHVCDNWGLGNDLRPSWWQLVTLFKLPQIDPLRCVDVGWGWKQDWLAISNKYVMSEPTSQSDLKCRQKTPTKNIRSAKLNNKRWLAPDRDWWYVHVNWRGGHGVTMETANVGAYVIGSIRAHTNLHLCHRTHGRHPTRLVWRARRLSVRTRHCSQIAHTKPHTSSLEAVTPAYGDLCQVGVFFFCFSPTPFSFFSKLKQWLSVHGH